MFAYFAAALIVYGSPALDDPKAGRHLVFDEEFKKPGPIDQTKWLYDDGPVYNDEKEHYTSSAANSTVRNGHLDIVARDDGGRITSARIQSRQAWKYGYFEFKAKVPGGRGTWPAIWMLNDRIRHPNGPKWPDCGEIDIMEEVGFDPDSFHFSLHSANYNWMRKEQRTKAVPAEHATDQPHVFGLDWAPDHIAFYLDGKEAYKVEKAADDFGSWPYRDPFYLILNLAIGGNWGGQKGVDNAIFPSTFQIDYVRIYQ